MPNPSPNGICAHNIIREMVKQGDQITCIAYAEFNSSKTEILNDVIIHRIKRNFVDNMISWCASKKFGKISDFLMKLLIILSKIKQIILLPFYPWTDLLYTGKLYRKAVSLHCVERFDMVIAVHTPLETLIVGTLLKYKFSNIKYISYFLDSLSGGFNLRILPDRWSIKRRLFWEKMLLKNADWNVMMSSSFAHYQKYSLNTAHYKKTTFLDIPLLYKEDSSKESTNSVALNSTHITILYTGSLFFSTRNPQYFLDLMIKLDREDVDLIFIGRSDCRSLLEEAKNKIAGGLQYFDHMEHDSIVGIIDEADLLLNFGVKNNNAISGKIFEYMSHGKPIISTFEIDEEPCLPYLEQYEASLMIDQRQDLESNRLRLNDFIDKFSNVNVPFNKTEKAFYNNTPRAFIRILDAVIGEDLI